jgi:hypothetical protein
MQCPTCGEETEVDHTPWMDQDKPFERVCFCCGWFDMKRYKTREEIG